MEVTMKETGRRNFKMNVKKKCVAILAIVIAAMAVWGVVVTVKCAGDDATTVIEQEQPRFNDDKVKLITHQQYINDALDPNAIYIVKEDWVANGNGSGHIEDCDCGYDYIAYRGDIPAGMVVSTYMVVDNKHQYEVLARFDYVGGQLVDVK